MIVKTRHRLTSASNRPRPHRPEPHTVIIAGAGQKLTIRAEDQSPNAGAMTCQHLICLPGDAMAGGVQCPEIDRTILMTTSQGATIGAKAEVTRNCRRLHQTLAQPKAPCMRIHVPQMNPSIRRPHRQGLAIRAKAERVDLPNGEGLFAEAAPGAQMPEREPTALGAEDQQLFLRVKRNQIGQVTQFVVAIE